MPKIFETLDKFEPFYDYTYKVVLFICKLLLILDIVITAMTVLGRYVSFIPDPSWSEEVILTSMSYLAVLAAALAIKKGAHIRMTALDSFLPKKVIKVSNVLADIAVMALAIIMIFVGWDYAVAIGARGTYVSMPTVSRFWMYFPVCVAGVAMFIFEIESLYNNIKAFFINDKEVA